MSDLTRFCVLAVSLFILTPATAEDPCLSFSYTLSDAYVLFHPDSGEIEFSVTLSIAEDEGCPASAEFPSDVQAFQCAIAHDDSLITATDTDVMGSLLDLNDGVGPEFVGVNLEPAGGPGITIGVLFALAADEFAQFDVEEEVLRLHYATVPTGVESLEEPTTTHLEFRDTLGAPVIPNDVAVDGDSYPADTTDGVVTIDPAGEVCFVRGAVNTDGFTDMADAVFLIRYLLLGGAEPGCMKAADFTDSGTVDIADPIRILQWLFSDGTPPKTPFPDCGPDPTEDSLTCETPTSGC